MGLLREGLVGAARTTHVEEMRGTSRRSIERSNGWRAGDLCLVLVDQVKAALAHLGQRVNGGLTRTTRLKG